MMRADCGRMRSVEDDEDVAGTLGVTTVRYVDDDIYILGPFGRC